MLMCGLVRRTIANSAVADGDHAEMFDHLSRVGLKHVGVLTESRTFLGI